MTLPLKPSRHDTLAPTADVREIELSEQELTCVSGGKPAATGGKKQEYLIVTMSDVLISSYN